MAIMASAHRPMPMASLQERRCRGPATVGEAGRVPAAVLWFRSSGGDVLSGWLVLGLMMLVAFLAPSTGSGSAPE
jgi:hypothetical protein